MSLNEEIILLNKYLKDLKNSAKHGHIKNVIVNKENIKLQLEELSKRPTELTNLAIKLSNAIKKIKLGIQNTENITNILPSVIEDFKSIIKDVEKFL